MTGINVDFIGPNTMPFISIGPAKINTLTVNGSLSVDGNLDLKNHQVLNLTTPVNNTDAANKLYVDETVASGTSILTQKGDMLIRGTTANEAMHLGTDGQHLVANGTTGLPQWQSMPAVPSVPLSNNGDMLVRGPSANAAVPVGTSGQVLTVDLADPNKVAWKTPSAASLLVSAKGDLLSHDASNPVVLSSDNVNGDVLTVDSTAVTGLKWKTPASTSIPFTAKGDLISYNGTTSTVLPSDNVAGDILTVDPTASTGLKWKTPASSTIPFTAKGDLVSYNGSATTVLPSDNVNGDVLTVDSTAATGLKWKTPTSTVLPVTTKGDLITHDNTTVTVLPSDNVNGDVLTVDSTAATGLKWKTPASTILPVTTKGDLITHNDTVVTVLASDNVNGNVLTVDSTSETGLKWKTPSPAAIPFTAKGDLLSYNGTTATVLPSIGADQDVLTINTNSPTGLAWRTPSSAVLPLYNTGDMLVRGPVLNSGLPVGTFGQVLTARPDTTLKVVWQDPEVTRLWVETLLATNYVANAMIRDVDARNAFRMKNVPLPDNDSDVVPRIYVTNQDTATLNSAKQYSNSMVPLATWGDILVRGMMTNTAVPIGNTGDVLTADLVDNNKIKWAAPDVTKLWVNTQLASYVKYTLTQNLDGNLACRLINILPPSASNDATTKDYVDTNDTSVLNSANSHSDALIPLTAKGDIFTRTETGSARLPVGNMGYILQTNTATPTGLNWVDFWSFFPGNGDTITFTQLHDGGGADISVSFHVLQINNYCICSIPQFVGNYQINSQLRASAPTLLPFSTTTPSTGVIYYSYNNIPSIGLVVLDTMGYFSFMSSSGTGFGAPGVAVGIYKTCFTYYIV